MTIAICVCVLMFGLSFHAWRITKPVLASGVLSIPWPYDMPAKIEFPSPTAGIEFTSADSLYDPERKAVRLHASITNPEELVEARDPAKGIATVLLRGKYSTAIRRGYVPSWMLEEIASRDLPSTANTELKEAHKAAQSLLEDLNRLKDQSGIIDGRFIHLADLSQLVANQMVEEREVMLSPKDFQLLLELPVDVVPARSPWAVFIALALGIAALVSAIRRLSLRRSGNEIVLSAASFADSRNQFLYTNSLFTVPWGELDASEDADTKEIIVRDRKSGRSSSYAASTVEKFEELRAALIAKVGITQYKTIVVRSGY